MKRSLTWKIAALVPMLITTALVPHVADADEHGPWFVDPTTLPFTPLTGATATWGVLDHAGYRIEVPENWNGELVMWAHGYRGEGFELTVDNPPIRRHLVERGYAWAASSYAENSYNILTGVESTETLARFASDEVLPSAPARTYLAGASMGGHITGVSIERYDIYDGAMPICGVMGDFELFDYFLDFNLAAQQLALGESNHPVETAEYFGTTVPTIKAELEGVPGGFPFLLSETGEQFKQLVELRSGGDRPNFDEAFAYWNGFPTATGFGNFLFDLGDGDGSLPNTDGASVVDNSTTRYQLDLSPGRNAAERALDRDIARVAPDAGARDNGEAITGDIDVPVLSLHNLGDLFVPFSMEIDYEQDVRRNGNKQLLVQRAIRGVGHCDFTPLELTTAFDDLTHWVETGQRPEGDDVRHPKSVAADDFGCRFSDPDLSLHTFAAPCP
ncbi:MAG: hypothetical protein R8G01_20735 [Ilumatobacteraceae bacterium]|nr:hypothetical protein [Ilumatobacteraceae bacterium]